MTKTYRGRNLGHDTTGPVTVTVDEGRGQWPLEHQVRHSPTGFSWGYGGSGPADLARSIMWDHLGGEPHPACYQAFKFAVVAGWSIDDDWQLRSEEIDDWLAGYDGPRLTADEAP